MRGTDFVPFENTTVNDGNAFNLHAYKFTALLTDYYWIHFSVSIPTDTLANVRLLGYFMPFDIVRNHTDFLDTSITTLRDGIMFLESSTNLWLSSEYAIYSDQYLQTSFSGFLLTSLMDPLDIFSVAMSTSIIKEANIRISYDTVNIDTASAWNSTSTEYIAPFHGTYVISLSTGAFPEANHVVKIRVNNELIASNVFCSECHTGLDVISRTIITTLMVGDRLYTQFDRWGNVLYSLYGSTRQHLTTLKGFLYSPHRSVPISWWVGRSKEDYYSDGEMYPLKFDCILINEGHGWNTKSNKYLVPLAGVYYIHLTTGACNARSKLELMRNGLPVVNVQIESNTTSCFTISRAIILRLKKYEELCIRLPSGYRVCSNGHTHISFAGFRIYV